jgi:outer membrane lipoprotein carrier protein
MSTIRISAVALLAMLVIGSTGDAALRRDDVAQIVRKTQDLYRNTRSGEVKFVQEGAGVNAAGTLVFAEGNKYRLEFPRQTIVSNGTKTWRYMPERNQVVISKTKGTRTGLTPSEILTSFPGEYKTSLVGTQKINGRNVWVVRCTTGGGKQIGDVNRATLYIDQSTYRFQQIEIESPTVGKMTMRITSAQYNVSIPGSRFSYIPPKNARVVDLSK